MTQYIEAKVAAVAASDQVALNAGSEAGVVVGAKVSLFRDAKVCDPDSDEVLGTVQYTRLSREVIHLGPMTNLRRVPIPTPEFGA